MRQILPITFLICFLALGFSPGRSVLAQQTGEGEVVVFSPLPGEAVQGLVQIIGTVDVEGFQSYELAFAFKDDATQTWFQIAQGDTPVIQGVLTEWDTTVLTDSTYHLLLRVHLRSGLVTDLIIEGIRVRNYSPIETSTPAPTDASGDQQGTPIPSPAPPTETPILPTPTDLPPNPAAVDSDQLTRATLRGGITGAVLTVVLLLYMRTKRRNNTL
jgi:hypothetical protein